MLPSASRYASALAILRIFTGLAWISHGIGKVTNPGFGAPGGGFESIAKDLIAGTTGPYHDFVVGVVLPHAATFAFLDGWGEMLTGISLLLGLFSRLGGAGGLFLALNYWMAKAGYAQWTSVGGLDLVHAALSAINLALPTGLVWGIDGLIASRRRPAA